MLEKDVHVRLKVGITDSEDMKSTKLFYFLRLYIPAAWLAQLVGRQTSVREVEPGRSSPDQHSES